jgi:hypothetical protein
MALVENYYRLGSETTPFPLVRGIAAGTTRCLPIIKHNIVPGNEAWNSASTTVVPPVGLDSNIGPPADNPEETFLTRALETLSIAVSLALLVPSASLAGSASWDGTWSGMLNKSEPVSVTIAGGKVVGYSIRGVAPYGIEFSSVSRTTVSFGDRANYNVKITKKGEKSAQGFAHGPMGDGVAFLTKE